MLADWDGRQLRLYNQEPGLVQWSSQVRQQLESRLPRGIALPVMQGELEMIPGGGGYEDSIFWVWTHQESGNVMTRYNDLSLLKIWGDRIQLLKPLAGVGAKQELHDNLYKTGAEGLVFWKMDAPYQSGSGRSKFIQKYKFIETADCLVTGWRITVEKDVNGYRHGVADCHVVGDDGLPVYMCSPHVRESELQALEACDAKHGPGRAVLEVQYLYFTGDSLVQPISKEVRLDKVGLSLEDAITRRSDLRLSKLYRTQ